MKKNDFKSCNVVSIGPEKSNINELRNQFLDELHATKKSGIKTCLIIRNLKKKQQLTHKQKVSLK
jgi:cupin superfamily acireductone dioxygenase involved in methionine salvage